jgi:hypothetical protein
MSDVVEILCRDPILLVARCAGCSRQYRTAQAVARILALRTCQVCRPQQGNPTPSPFKGKSRKKHKRKSRRR